VLTTNQEGAIAETAIVHAAVKLGIGLFKLISDGERYDLIFDVGSRLLRVQCKWATRMGTSWRCGRTHLAGPEMAI
jgi:PD-(D/E)XK nuclease superfamily protein